jgi:hypothetical protein
MARGVSTMPYPDASIRAHLIEGVSELIIDRFIAVNDTFRCLKMTSRVLYNLEGKNRVWVQGSLLHSSPHPPAPPLPTPTPK